MPLVRHGQTASSGIDAFFVGSDGSWCRVIDPPSGNTSISFFCPAAGPGGRAGLGINLGESPRQILIP